METLRRTVSDGSQSLYDVDFTLGYFEQGHIYVYAGDDHALYETQLTYVWQNDTQIELTVPEEYVAGTVINVRRVVPRDELYVEFKNSTGTTEKSLNQGNLQALMLLQEQDDGFKPEAFYEKQDLLFDNLYTCKQLVDGVDDQDAVTMKQVFDLDKGYFASVVKRTEDAAELAEKWAQEDEDVPVVEPDDYSAKHWAKKAEEEVSSIQPDSLVKQTDSTGALVLPIGTTAERPATPLVNHERWNSELGYKERWDGTEWVEATGGGGGQVDSVVGTTDEINVDSADPANPILSISPNFGGDITTIWTGIAGNGVTVDWSGTGYVLSQFDAIKIEALINGAHKCSAEFRPSDMLTGVYVIAESGLWIPAAAVNYGYTSGVYNTTETSTVSSINQGVSLTTAGVITAIYGINYK